MYQTLIVLALLPFTLGGCSSSRTSEAQTSEPPNQNVEASDNAAVAEYVEGFFPPERNQTGEWRWMGPTGLIKLRNTHQPMMLKIRGRVPVEQLPGASTITFEFNGQPMDDMKASKDTIETEYRIAAAQQGSDEWSELRIRATESFIPHDIDPKSADRRRLAFSLYSVGWQAQ